MILVQGYETENFNCFFVKRAGDSNCEEELPKKPVGRLSVNCRPSVDRQVKKKGKLW